MASAAVGRFVNSKGYSRFLVFLIGALGYGILEVAWRGYTHWTMELAGGICLLFIYKLEIAWGQGGLLKKAFWAALVITGVEFVVGFVVNLLLGWQVWDYSDLRFNILGQISLAYSCIWFFLAMPLLSLSRYLYQRL